MQRCRLPLVLAVLLAVIGPASARAQTGGQTGGRTGAGDAPLVLVTPVEGAIGPPTTRQITRAIDTAAERGAAMLVLRMDTPGGLSSSTRDINRAILAAPVPVAVFVAPSGARAASAGTYILYASHVAAMAPGTNLGAATPVSMGGGSPLPGGGSGEDGGKDDGESTDKGAGGDALAHKRVNDAVASIRSLAELRGRNADWAEKAVREAASLPASAALEKGVVEYIVPDTAALAEAADGRTVSLAGTDTTLATAGARVETLERGTVTRILAVLANPNVALLLMTLGFYGLVFEFLSPGLGPSIPGVILLVLGLYSLNMLPVDYAGLALLGLGLGLMAAEAVTPAFGILGAGGAAAFGIGAAILVDTDIAAYRVSWSVIGTVTGLSLVFLTLVLGAVIRTRRQAPRTTTGLAPGDAAVILDWEAGRGQVRAHGERWAARGPADLARGETVEITAAEGLTLYLRRPETRRPETQPPPEETP